MVAFEVEDMSCAGCATTVTRATKGIEDAADVRVDLAATPTAVGACGCCCD